MRQPLAIDLFAGLGGWTEGLLSEGYTVVGFDIERHHYGEAKYPAQLVLQDVLTIHGRQFKNAALIVASPPCQEYSYMAMPWSRAKQIEREYLDGTRNQADLTALFDACFRIQREACAAAGHHIPMVVENVRGAQKWVGRSRWNFGSFHLWGDVPALMPITMKAIKGHGGAWFKDSGDCDGKYGPGNFRIGVDGLKNTGGSWFAIGSPGQKETGRNPVHELAGIKQPGISGPRFNGKGDLWFQEGAAKSGSKSAARKSASALIAKIPLVLSSHIARAWKPSEATA